MKRSVAVCIALAFVLSACEQQTSLPTEPEANAALSKRGPSATPVPVAEESGPFSTGPSAFCHDTDGAFTDCDPGGGLEEWSDIIVLDGLGTSAGARVYSDQRTSPTARLYLMYDLTGHPNPLAIDSFFDITFDVFEHGEFEEYKVECFGDGTFKVFEDGEDITAEADVDCAVGFGTNGQAGDPPNVLVELDIDREVTYSPDIPLFWSTHAPPRGDRCPPGQECPPEANALPPDFITTSSTILIASADGTTQVVGLPVGGVTPADLCRRKPDGGLLVGLFELYRPGSRNHGQFMKKVTHMSKMALGSLAHSGLIAPGDVGPLHGCVVSALAKKK